MSGKGNKKFKIPKKLLPSPKKIATRGLFEILSSNSPKRDYGKRVKTGKY